ncbi:unnamed protein product, partial [Aureobasidium pullulans]
MPAQINVKPEMTVEAFIKGRATALRELIPNPIFLQYGLTSIAATSSAAQDAVYFQSALNIVPPQSTMLTITDDVPGVWRVVSSLPWMQDAARDRQAVLLWLKETK